MLLVLVAKDALFVLVVRGAGSGEEQRSMNTPGAILEANWVLRRRGELSMDRGGEMR